MSFAEHRKISQALKEFESKLNLMVMDMGNIALNQTLKTFRDQGYTDELFQPWKRRKNKDSKRGRGFRWERLAGDDDREGKKFKVKTTDVRSVKNRATLIKSGDLRKSIRKKKRSMLSISIFSDLPYSGVHNEGLMAGRGRGFKMKERRMIGDSAIMRRLIGKSIGNRISKIFTQ